MPLTFAALWLLSGTRQDGMSLSRLLQPYPTSSPMISSGLVMPSIAIWRPESPVSRPPLPMEFFPVSGTQKRYLLDTVPQFQQSL